MEENTGQSRGSNSLLIIVVIIALVVLGGYFLMRRQGGTATPTSDNGGTTGTETTETSLPAGETIQTFMVEGTEFSFGPPSLTVQSGIPVNITFTNTGKMPHDFIIDEIPGARTQVLQPGQSETIQFTPATAGTFSYYCGVGSHRAQGMEGTLVVQ